MMIDTWFGDAEEPTLGFVELPTDGAARAGVIVCPPLGYEQFNAYRAMRYLGQQLAGAGFATLRFDYRGEGDAAGDAGRPDAAERWLATIADAAAYLRAAGLERLVLVGLSSGALLAAEAAATVAGVEALVLWDPATSGRRFLRRQRSLHELTVGARVTPDPDQVLLLSTPLHRDTADWLSAREITAASLDALEVPVLALARRTAIAAACTLAGPRTEVRPVDGQDELLDVPSALAVIPVATIDGITRWVADAVAGPAVAVRPAVQSSAVVAKAADGVPIVERLSRVGVHRLFTIETVRADGAAAGVVVMQPAAAEHRAGAGRLQVRAARELAARGHRAIRFDRRITGDSTEVRPDEQSLVLAEAWVDDAAELVAEVAAGDRVGLMGVCSGAWVAARIADRQDARLTVLVGPNYYRTAAMAPDEYVRIARANDDGAGTPRFAGVKRTLRDALPRWAWRVASRLQVVNDPARLLGASASPRRTLALLLTPDDVRLFEDNRGVDAVARLHGDGADVRVTGYPFGDHALLGEDVQQAALADLLDLVDEALPAPPVEPPLVELVETTPADTRAAETRPAETPAR